MVALRVARRVKEGAVFGRLTVLHVDGLRVACRCSCGKKCAPHRSNLLSGRTASCGCLWRERVKRHGGVGTPEYAVWCAVVQRCTNKKSRSYANYGGRGITLHPAWRSFAVFLKAVGKRPRGRQRMTIERRDNSRGYVPGNVYWAPYSAQNRNKRDNHLLTFRGRTACVTDWAREVDVSVPTILRRLNEGWSVRRTLTTRPLERGRRVSAGR